MNMVLIGIDLFQDNVGMVLWPRSEKLLEIALNTLIENIPSILGRPYQVKVTSEHDVAHSTIHCHIPSISYSVNNRTP